MLTVHHLGKSQSERIVWLCEELGIPYELKHTVRDSQTMLAPAPYKAMHPIGSAPVITDGDLVLAESGAIVEYILAKYGNGRLALPPSHPDFASYLYWFHFANGTLQAGMGRLMILNRLKLYPSAKVVPGSVAFKAVCAEADFKAATGDRAAALASYATLLTAIRAGGLDADSLEDTVDLSNTYVAMSDLHRSNQNPDQADKIWAERTALWNGWARRLPGNAFVQRQLAVKPSR